MFAGIFAYLNYLVPATRREILEKLITGLKRLEYRGYDSAGQYTRKSYFSFLLLILSIRETPTNSQDSDETQHNTAFHQGLHC